MKAQEPWLKKQFASEMGLSQVPNGAEELETQHLAGFQPSGGSCGGPSSQEATAPWRLRAGAELLHDGEELLVTVCERLSVGYFWLLDLLVQIRLPFISWLFKV